MSTYLPKEVIVLREISWSLHNGDTNIVIMGWLQLGTYSWNLYYPSKDAPDDTPPNLTPVQENQVQDIKLQLKQAWGTERNTLNTLLKVWDDTPAITLARHVSRYVTYKSPGVLLFGTCTGKVYQLRYDFNSEYSRSYRLFTIKLHIVIDYVIEVSTGEIELECNGYVSFAFGMKPRVEEDKPWEDDLEGEFIINRFTVPIMDGVIDRTPLVEYLNNNPLLELGADLQAFSDRLGNN